MSKEWITNSVKDKTMQNPANLKNRWVYLMLGTPAASNPFVTKTHPQSNLKLTAAPGVMDHLEAILELIGSGDHYNIQIHDKHKPTHGITDTFDRLEIDKIETGRKLALSSQPKKPGPKKVKNPRLPPPREQRQKKEKAPENEPSPISRKKKATISL